MGACRGAIFSRLESIVIATSTSHSSSAIVNLFYRWRSVCAGARISTRNINQRRARRRPRACPVSNPAKAAVARSRIVIVMVRDQPGSERGRTRPANTCTCASFGAGGPKDTYARRMARTSPRRHASVSQVPTLAGLREDIVVG